MTAPESIKKISIQWKSGLSPKSSAYHRNVFYLEEEANEFITLYLNKLTGADWSQTIKDEIIATTATTSRNKDGQYTLKLLSGTETLIDFKGTLREFSDAFKSYISKLWNTKENMPCYVIDTDSVGNVREYIQVWDEEYNCVEQIAMKEIV